MITGNIVFAHNPQFKELLLELRLNSYKVGIVFLSTWEWEKNGYLGLKHIFRYKCVILNRSYESKINQSEYGWHWIGTYITGTRSTCTLFYTRYQLRSQQNGHTDISAKIWMVSYFWIVQYTIYSLNFVLGFKKKTYTGAVKNMCLLCIYGFWFFFQKVNLPFLHIKRAHKYL